LQWGSQKRCGIRKKDVELKNVMCMLFVKCSKEGFEKLFLKFSQN
jgi:hypothetical protein